MVKKCRKCGRSDVKFYPDKAFKDGYKSTCGKCLAKDVEKHRSKVRSSGLTNRHAYRLKTWYGINEDEFLHIFSLQEGSCALCKEPFKGFLDAQVDHDHSCCPGNSGCCGNCIRGLLCRTCNVGLGHYERLRSMGLLDEIEGYIRWTRPLV